MAVMTALAGFAAVFGAIVQGAYGRRKIAAETENINIKTAMETNASLRGDVAELRAYVEVLRQRTAAAERRERLLNRRLAKHEAWDLHAVDKLRERGVDIGEPPSLTDDDADPGARTRAEDFGMPGTALPTGEDRRQS